MIVGTAVGSLLLIFILLVFIGVLYWKLSSRLRYEKELSNEIRYCTAAPTDSGADLKVVAASMTHTVWEVSPVLSYHQKKSPE